jgi:hypothetical protein
MAKIDFYIPEPTPQYSTDNQRQIIQALDTLKSQLNTSYSEEVLEDFQTFAWFLIGTGRKSHLVPVNNFTTSVTGTQLALTVASVTVVLT